MQSVYSAASAVCAKEELEIRGILENMQQLKSASIFEMVLSTWDDLLLPRLQFEKISC